MTEYTYELTEQDVSEYKKIVEECSGDEDKAMHLWTRWKCLTDLFYLGTMILGLGKAYDRKLKRHRLDPVLHQQLARDLQEDDNALSLYPRFHMKSTWVKMRIVQLILIDPNVRIGMWSRAASLVRSELANIKTFFMSAKLKELFPDIIPERKAWIKDTSEEMTIWRDPDAERKPQENQVEVWGIDATVTGRHYDYHFYDDILDDKSVTTTDQIMKVDSWFKHVQGIREPGTIEKMTGTRYHMNDLYGTIIREEYFDRVTVRRAIENGKPIYSYLTLKYLSKLKKVMGATVFSHQMMNDALPSENRIFTPPYATYDKLPSDPEWYVAVDPAPTTHTWSNSTGIVIGCVSRKASDCVYVVEALKLKEKPEVIARVIAEKIYYYRPRKVGIEYGLQQALKPLIDLNLKVIQSNGERIILPTFLEIKNAGVKKADRINRILGAMVRDGRVFFNKGLYDLFLQMDYFNPLSEDNDDDVVDAATMLIQTIEIFSIGVPLNVREARKPFSLSFNNLLEMIAKKSAKKDGWGKDFAN